MILILIQMFNKRWTSCHVFLSFQPIVGHNSFMDLVFLYDKFHKPLPSKFEFPIIFNTIKY